jgi:nicotinamide phosphoribosyltransferase
MTNIITQTDSYKLNHWNQYPAGTQAVYSYFESRKGAKFDQTPFFGLQYILKAYLEGVRVTEDKLNQARLLVALHFGQTTIEKITPYIFNKHLSLMTVAPTFTPDGQQIGARQVINPEIRIDWKRYFAETGQKEMFNFNGWNHILKAHGGKLPVRIKAVPEGTPVPTGNVLMTVENTDEKCFWLTNALESLLTHVWYPSTVAALSRQTKVVIKKFLEETGTVDFLLNFKLHDFGYRGVNTDEGACVGGAAHLVNFMGTDTVPAMEFAMFYYSANPEGLAYSVAATEHSVMTALGVNGEEEVLDNLLREYPTGILSVVADSYDIYNFVENLVGGKFKNAILNRDGIFVVRPDSITPTHMTPEAEMVWIVQKLADKLGYTVNDKGYLTINPKVRVLWGDGIDLDGITKILQALKDAKLSTDNLACFGMGGGLLQKVNRDTQRFAFKSCAQKRNDRWFDIFKNPKDLSKASKKGRLKLVRVAGAHGLGWDTVPESDPRPDVLETVFENGEVTKTYTFDEVRKNAAV